MTPSQIALAPRESVRTECSKCGQNLQGDEINWCGMCRWLLGMGRYHPTKEQLAAAGMKFSTLEKQAAERIPCHFTPEIEKPTSRPAVDYNGNSPTYDRFLNYRNYNGSN